MKAVLFDLDNTLIDFMKMKEEAVSASVSAMVTAGIGLEKKKAEKLLFEIYWKIGIEDQQIFQEFLKKVKGTVDNHLLAKAILAYRGKKAEFARPLPGAVKIVKSLKKRGYKVGIVSDAPGINAWIRLCQMGIDSLFDVVITLDETGEKKPSSKPFNLALKELSILPQDVVYVGDRPERDIKGAKKLGMKTVFARYGNRDFKGKSGADWEIKDIKEVLEVIDGT